MQDKHTEVEHTETFVEGDLTIRVEETKYLIRVSWLGQCTVKNPSLFLDPVLKAQYEKSRKEIKRMIFDFTRFKFMNSSAIIPIIKVLKTAKEHRDSIHIVYNKDERWQMILLGELRIFETPDGRIKVLGVAP